MSVIMLSLAAPARFLCPIRESAFDVDAPSGYEKQLWS
jgi:hypothetical protein